MSKQKTVLSFSKFMLFPREYRIQMGRWVMVIVLDYTVCIYFDWPYDTFKQKMIEAYI